MFCLVYDYYVIGSSLLIYISQNGIISKVQCGYDVYIFSQSPPLNINYRELEKNNIL